VYESRHNAQLLKPAKYVNSSFARSAQFQFFKPFIISEASLPGFKLGSERRQQSELDGIERREIGHRTTLFAGRPASTEAKGRTPCRRPVE
jgi:hypothetical protein